MKTFVQQVGQLVRRSPSFFATRTSEPAPRRGMDPLQDIAHSLPKFKAEVVFDIGANTGQSTQVYLRQFSQARIYSFEPVSETFWQLQQNLVNAPQVECHPLAFGAVSGRGQMVLQDSPDMYFLFSPNRADLDHSTSKATNKPVPSELVPTELAPMEPVEVTTLDEFCRDQLIERINFLKIDTEGGDLEVLQGANQLLSQHCIDCLQVEAGMHPENLRHVPLERIKGFLESYRYFLFGIYEQVSEEWLNGEPHLRWANLLFISDALRQQHRTHPLEARTPVNPAPVNPG